MVHVITSKAEFDQILKENEKVVLDAWATWCGPCKLIGPVFAKLEPKFEGIKFVKVDVDEQSEIAQQLQIRAMPTFIAFVGGERFDDFVGAVPKKLEELLVKVKDAPVLEKNEEEEAKATKTD